MPSKRPENTAFKQQRLRSWQPLLTPKTVIPSFFVIGLIFIPIGIVLQLASDAVQEVRFDYSQCSTVATSTMTSPSTTAGLNNGINLWSYNSTTKVCQIQFTVPTQMTGPVYIYYRLTNFYQNNRVYVKSYDSNQLSGSAVNPVDSACGALSGAAGAAFLINNNLTQVATNAVYYPCGLIANSLFSDNIGNLNCASTSCLVGNQPTNYIWDNSSVAWPSDASRYGASAYLQTYPDDASLALNVVPPPFWQTAFPQWANGYTHANFPNLNNWPAFQVWMRTAGLPTFRKLWGVNSLNYLAAGNWNISITQNFDTSKYGGSKSIVISTTSLLGGKNSFLGGAYILTGLLCVCLAVAFLIRNMINPRKLGDHKLLSWNNNEGAAAAAARKDEQALLGQGPGN